MVERREREVERERVSKSIRPGRPQMMRVGTLVSEKSQCTGGTTVREKSQATSTTVREKSQATSTSEKTF